MWLLENFTYHIGYYISSEQCESRTFIGLSSISCTPVLTGIFLPWAQKVNMLLTLLLFLFLVGLGFELGLHAYKTSTLPFESSPVHFALVILEMGLFCPGWP
jgi:hypothetical protein